MLLCLISKTIVKMNRPEAEKGGILWLLEHTEVRVIHKGTTVNWAPRSPDLDLFLELPKWQAVQEWLTKSS